MKPRFDPCALALCLMVGPNASGLVLYVDLNSTNATSPYTNWSIAATVIQDAVDVARDGDQILVTNGVYQTGGRAVYGSLTNRVAVDRAVTVQSVNGPAVTVIRGNGPVGNDAVRCVYLTNNALLSGFTLTDGATRNSGEIVGQQSGGGAWCEGTNCVVTNCLVVSNTAYAHGGGIRGGIDPGGRYGGSGGARVINCTFIANSARVTGGGANICTLINCLLVGNFNSGPGDGGASSGSIMINCTICTNTRAVFDGTLNNCIMYYNSGYNYTTCVFSNCCTTPTQRSQGNFTNAPLFVDLPAGDLHLQSNSPCINAGNSAYPPTDPDIDGKPRIRGDTVDLGAYEFQSPSSLLSYAWAQQYGLPTDGSADFTDEDGDGMNNWQEWRASTVPTNASSALRMLPLSNDIVGLRVSWQSVGGVIYTLERSTNLTPPTAFATIQRNIVGQDVATSFTDTNTPTSGPCFYRVGVQ